MWQQWINFILGLWVIAIPFIGINSANLMWTLVATGVVMAALSLWGALYEQSDTHRRDLGVRTA